MGDKQGVAYLTGTHRYSYRFGESAEVVGVVWYTREGKEGRPCYKIRYPDGVIDYVVICDSNNYELTKEPMRKEIEDV